MPDGELPAPVKGPSVVAELVERLGLSTVLLLAAVYFGYQSVIQPLADSYRQMVKEVSETNKLLQEEIRDNDREDGERVAIIVKRMDELNTKLDRILEKLPLPMTLTTAGYGMTPRKRYGGGRCCRW